VSARHASIQAASSASFKIPLDRPFRFATGAKPQRHHRAGNKLDHLQIGEADSLKIEVELLEPPISDFKRTSSQEAVSATWLSAMTIARFLRFVSPARVMVGTSVELQQRRAHCTTMPSQNHVVFIRSTSAA